MEVVSSFFNSSDDTEKAGNKTKKSGSNDYVDNSNQVKEPLKPLSQMANQLATEKLIERLLYMSLPSSSSKGFLSNDSSLSDQESILKANQNKFIQIPLSKNSVFSNDKYDLLKLLSYENRLKYAASRPGLSIQIMSKNFINLNSRLSLPFFVVDLVEEFLTWKNPFFTLSVAMIVSFLILNPNKVLVLVPLLIYTQLITPNFYQKYKPNEYLRSQMNSFSNEQILPVTCIEPEKELSKEFILNITDLQNRMSLYVDVWNMVVAKLNDYYIWQNDTRTTIQTMVIFVAILTVSFVSISLKYFFLVGFILLLFVQHPMIKSKFLAKIYSEDTRLSLLSTTNSLTSKIESNLVSVDAEKRTSIKTCTAVIQQKKVGMCWETTTSLDDYAPPVNYIFVKGSDWRLILGQSNNALHENDELKDSYDNWRYSGVNGDIRERTYARYITREVLLDDADSKKDNPVTSSKLSENNYEGLIVL